MAIGTAAALIGSAIIGGVAANRAASKSAKAARAGIRSQNELLGPYSQAGAQGLGAVQDFVDSGSEQNFRDTQAFKDIINSARAGGANRSGNRDTALGDYLMTNYRPQRLNELMMLPTVGANASAQQATNLMGGYQNLGNTQAAGIMGMGNAASNALNSYAYLQNYNAGKSTGGFTPFNPNAGSGLPPLTYTGYGMGQQTPQQRYGNQNYGFYMPGRNT